VRRLLGVRIIWLNVVHNHLLRYASTNFGECVISRIANIRLVAFRPYFTGFEFKECCGN